MLPQLPLGRRSPLPKRARWPPSSVRPLVQLAGCGALLTFPLARTAPAKNPILALLAPKIDRDDHDRRVAQEKRDKEQEKRDKEQEERDEKLDKVLEMLEAMKKDIKKIKAYTKMDLKRKKVVDDKLKRLLASQAGRDKVRSFLVRHLIAPHVHHSSSSAKTTSTTRPCGSTRPTRATKTTAPRRATVLQHKELRRLVTSNSPSRRRGIRPVCHCVSFPFALRFSFAHGLVRVDLILVLLSTLLCYCANIAVHSIDPVLA